MPGNIKDRYGMTLSTNSPDAAGRWQEGIDLLLSQSYGAEEKLQEAIDLDEGFAIAHGCLAFLHMTRARPDQARESVKRGLELADGISDRERRHIEAVNLWANGKGPDALALVREHLAECPRDAVLQRLAPAPLHAGLQRRRRPPLPAVAPGHDERTRPPLRRRLGLPGAVRLRSPRERHPGQGPQPGAAVPGNEPRQRRGRPLGNPFLFRVRRRCHRRQLPGQLAGRIRPPGPLPYAPVVAPCAV